MFLADDVALEYYRNDKVFEGSISLNAGEGIELNFKFSYQKAFLDVVFGRMAQNEKFFMKILEDSDFKETVMEFMFDEVY